MNGWTRVDNLPTIASSALAGAVLKTFLDILKDRIKRKDTVQDRIEASNDSEIKRLQKEIDTIRNSEITRLNNEMIALRTQHESCNERLSALEVQNTKHSIELEIKEREIVNLQGLLQLERDRSSELRAVIDIQTVELRRYRGENSAVLPG